MDDREGARELGDEDLVRAGRRHDPRGLVHGDATHVVADELDLANVDTRSYVEIICVGALADCGRAVDRPRGAVERRDDAIPGRRHLAPLKALELGACADEVLGEKLSPPRVAQPAGHLGRLDEICESIVRSTRL